ncbi:hypothetical protein LXA43DRAFT_994187 [Ganoderma leucocontextum]|nr:hypothetical protein LXA43DRAFT_994187 [Ganoderma leucocontextum]
MVFELLRAPTKVMDPSDLLRRSVFDTYKPLIHAMMVCHKWYVVASEKASLWTDVDYSYGRAGPTCLLERSGTAPIHLRLNLEGLAGDEAYFGGVVRTNASRLRQLDLADLDAKHTTAGQLLENDMPLLQCLRMYEEYYRRNAVSGNRLCRFPSLRGMILMGLLWLPAPEVGPLTKLTHLHISTLPDIPMGTITTLLDATPALEVLELHECRAVNQRKLPTRTTTLQHLTHLTIRRMFTSLAGVFMPALVLPRATTVCLWFDVDTHVTDAILPHPPSWPDVTRIHVDEDIYGSLSVELDGDAHRVALRLEYDPDDEWEDRPLWPLPVPTLLQLAQVSAAHLCILDWYLLPQLVSRVPALATLVVEARQVDSVNVGEMVGALAAVLLQEDPAVLCPGLREVALIASAAMHGLTERLAPALKKRRRDGRQIERLRTWIKIEAHTPRTTTARDMGDALAEYVGAGEVEHEEGAFWLRDEELWRRENEFWEVPRTWW